MTKRNQNFDMHIGESKTLAITVKNEDGSDYDFTGATAEWWLATTSHSPTALIRKILGAGIEVVTGGVEISLESEETYDLKPEIYYHELKITKQGVSVSTVGAALLRHALDMRPAPGQQKEIGRLLEKIEPVSGAPLIWGNPPVRDSVIPRRPADPGDVLKVTINQQPVPLGGSVSSSSVRVKRRG